MLTIHKHLSPLLLILAALTLFGAGIHVDYAQARSRSGGRSFSRSRTMRTPMRRTTPYNTNRYRNNGGFMRGMAGGFLGGALGSMLFGSMFGGAGMGGSGIGLLQILIIGGIIYFIFKKMRGNQGQRSGYYDPHPYDEMARENEPGLDDNLSNGLAQIRESEPDFDPNYFAEVAQDVFFKVQAGWTRRDVTSYRQLLGEQLAQEYEDHFREMKEKGEINRLENISVRQAKVIDGGVDGTEEFVVVHFTANLLDYTVDDQTNDLIRGSMTEPVKFDEKWTWARPVGSQNWKLEGIE